MLYERGGPWCSSPPLQSDRRGLKLSSDKHIQTAGRKQESRSSRSVMLLLGMRTVVKALHSPQPLQHPVPAGSTSVSGHPFPTGARMTFAAYPAIRYPLSAMALLAQPERGLSLGTPRSGGGGVSWTPSKLARRGPGGPRIVLKRRRGSPLPNAAPIHASSSGVFASPPSQIPDSGSNVPGY